MKIRSSLMLGGMLVALSANALADSSLTLTNANPSGANMGGVYTSPYVGTISGVGSDINIICDDFTDEVYLGETWNVISTNFAQMSTTGTANQNVLWDTGATALTQAQGYLTVAILTSELLSINSASTQAQDLSFAIWDVFNPNSSAGLSDSTNINNLLLAAKSTAATDLSTAGQSIQSALNTLNISNMTIYTPDPKGTVDGASPAVTGCPVSTCGQPQEFVTVSMPEPSSWGLLAVDLVAVLGIVLFFRRRSALNPGR